MCILIGFIVALLALSAAVALPSDGGSRIERPRGRRVPGDAGSAGNIVAQEAAHVVDGTYMPILR